MKDLLVIIFIMSQQCYSKYKVFIVYSVCKSDSPLAPYKAGTKQIQEAEGDKVLLTCQSEGYPESSVVWQTGHQQNLKPNTTTVLTPDQLYNVTSQIRVDSSEKNNYTCSFKNGGYSATFHIPGNFIFFLRVPFRTHNI